MKINSFFLAGLVFILLFGGIGFTSAMNWWQTESQKVPVKFSEGEAAGQYNPADIRGSYTFGDISEFFEIPLADLQSAFHIPMDADPADYQLKSLEEQFANLPAEVGTGSVRMFVAFYKGFPFDLEAAEDTYLLEEAIAILERQGRLTTEQSAYVNSHIAGSQSIPEVQATATPKNQAAPENIEPPASSEHTPEEYLVTGKTSFQNLVDWGVSEETVEAILGEDMPASQILIKDYASSKGIAFPELKGKLQAEVDKHE
jgi:hypothetical protein